MPLTETIIAHRKGNSNGFAAKKLRYRRKMRYNVPEMKKSALSVLSILLAGVLWGIIGIFIKKLSAAGLTPMQIVFVRLLIAAPVFLAATLILSPGKLAFRLRDIWIFLGTGVVSVALFNYCYFYTVVHSEASVAVVLLYTSPIFVMILSAVLFKEKIRPEKIVALAMTFIGCLLVSGVTGGGYTLRPLVALIGVASGLFYALYTIFGTFGLRKYDTMTVTTYTFLFAFLAALPVSDVGGLFTVLSATPSLWIWCVAISVLSTILPYFFYTWGLKSAEPSRAAILVAVEPIVGCMVGMIFYGESHNFLKILGILFVIGAILLLNAPRKTSDESIRKDV